MFGERSNKNMSETIERYAPGEQVAEVVTTINDKLQSKKRRLESELADINAALDALAANPEIARVLTLVGKAVGRI